ncbi:hypothetical protein EON77_19420, partial [bacterium]
MRFKLAFVCSLLTLASAAACAINDADDGAMETDATLDTLSAYRIVASGSGRAVGVADASLSPGAAVVQLAAGGDASGTWSLRRGAGGRYRIVNRNSAHCLSVRGASRAAGAELEQAICSEANVQEWTLRLQRGSDGYTVKNAHSHLCMATSGSGAELRQSACTNGANLVFRFDASTTPDPSADAGGGAPSDASPGDASRDDASLADASPPGPGTCSSTNLAGCQRGLYVSPYAERSGRNVFGVGADVEAALAAREVGART